MTLSRKPEPAASLTARETEVLVLVARGRSLRQAAEELGLSIRTVESYSKQIRLKLGARTQAHMVAQALRSGLIDPH